MTLPGWNNDFQSLIGGLPSFSGGKPLEAGRDGGRGVADPAGGVSATGPIAQKNFSKTLNRRLRWQTRKQRQKQ